MDLVSDDILQMALGSELLKKFGGSLGEEYYITLINAICCTFKQLAAMPLSTKRILVAYYIAASYTYIATKHFEVNKGHCESEYII